MSAPRSARTCALHDLAQAAAALCCVLEAALDHTAAGVVHARFTPALAAVSSAMGTNADGCVRSGSACVGQLLRVCAADAALWPLGAKAFSALLRLCLDSRPKVRRPRCSACPVSWPPACQH